MRYRLIRTSLLYAFLFVAGVNVLGLPFDGTIFSFLATPGLLLAPGIWVVYELFGMNNHDLLPLLMSELVNVLIYWIVFIPLLALLWRRKRGRSRGGVQAKTRQPRNEESSRRRPGPMNTVVSV